MKIKTKIEKRSLTHYESKKLKRYQWVHFLLAIYCWAWSLPLREVCLPSENPSEKKPKFSCTSGYQWEIAFGLGWGDMSASAFSSRILLVQNQAGLMDAASSCVRSHAQQFSWFRGACILGVLHPLWLLHSSLLLFRRLLWALSLHRMYWWRDPI